MNRLFACIFLAVTLMVSTVVISATEVNVYSEANEQADVAQASGGDDLSVDAGEDDITEDDTTDDAADEADDENSEAPDDSYTPEDGYTSDDNGVPDEDGIPEDNDTPDDDYTYEAPEEEVPALPDEEEIVYPPDIGPPEYFYSIITIINYPATAMPVGQGPAGTITVPGGANVDLVAGDAAGYIFSHWSFSSVDPYDIFENIAFANTIFQANVSDITITAHWVPVVKVEDVEDGDYVQVTFHPNGGAWADGCTEPRTFTLSVDADNNIQLPEDPEWPGHTFIGWNTQRDGEGEWFSGDINTFEE